MRNLKERATTNAKNYECVIKMFRRHDRKFERERENERAKEREKGTRSGTGVTVF